MKLRLWEYTTMVKSQYHESKALDLEINSLPYVFVSLFQNVINEL